MLPSIIHAAALPPANAPRGRRRRLRYVIAAIAVVFIIQLGMDAIVHRPRVAARLTARLQAAFGRPVKVAGYDFSLWTGPELTASSLVVGEDPRFGSEYFLYADRVTLHPRWLPLLRGRIAIRNLSFGHPSLNVVANADGRWNLAEWLPRGGGLSPGAPSGAAPAISRLEFTDGRINFKSGVVKIPFALVAVDGSVDQGAAGHWRIDLDAQPMRAAVLLQQVGTVHLDGTVGGTTVRLRPADLRLSWQDGSVADLLRLMRGDDMGTRGDFSLSLEARADGLEWRLIGQAQCRRLHRWDLPMRADDPTFNVTARGDWLPGSRNLELANFLFESARSNVQGAGFITGRLAGEAGAGLVRSADISLGASIATEDALSFFRAFHPGVAEELSAAGETIARVRAVGWPPRLLDGEISTGGVRLEGGSLAAPVRFGPADVSIVDGEWSLPDSDLAFEPDAGLFSLGLVSQHSVKKGMPAQAALNLRGRVDDARQVLTAAAALGFNLPRGWDVSGPAAASFQWSAPADPFAHAPSGSVTLDGVEIRAPFLARPVGPVEAQLDFSAQGEQLHLHGAQVFGSDWTGELSHRPGDAEWHGRLSTDAVDIARFDEYLNPARRESLLVRMLPFLRPAPVAASVPEALRWSGPLLAKNVQLGAFHLTGLRADAQLDGRKIQLENADATLWGGSVMGSFIARLNPVPAYESNLRFQRLDLSRVAAPSLEKRFAGVADGVMKISAAGVGRPALAASLKCGGSATVNGLQLSFVDLRRSLAEGRLSEGDSRFPSARANFVCANQRIQFTELRLRDQSTEIAGRGTFDFSRHLIFLLSESGSSTDRLASGPGIGALPRQYSLTGMLDSLDLHAVPTPRPR